MNFAEELRKLQEESIKEIEEESLKEAEEILKGIKSLCEEAASKGDGQLVIEQIEGNGYLSKEKVSDIIVEKLEKEGLKVKLKKDRFYLISVKEAPIIYLTIIWENKPSDIN